MASFSSPFARFSEGIRESLLRREEQRRAEERERIAAEELKLRQAAEARQAESLQLSTEMQRAALERQRQSDALAMIARAGVGGELVGPEAEATRKYAPGMVDISGGQMSLPATTLPMPTSAPGAPGDTQAPIVPAQELPPQMVDETVRSKGTPQQQALQGLRDRGTISPEILDLVEAGVLDGSSLARMLQPATGGEPPPVGSFEDFVLRSYGPNPTPEQIVKAREDFRLDDRQSAGTPYSQAMADYMKLLTEDRRRQLGGAGAFGVEDPSVRMLIDRATADTSSPSARSNKQRVLTALAESGDEKAFKDGVVQAAIQTESVGARNDVSGRIDLLNAIDQIEDTLGALKAKGIDTNIVRGTAEDLVRKLGASTDPELAALAQRLDIIRVQWRRAMTGVQFSQAEDDNYRKMFPNYKNVLPLNIALLGGMRADQALTHNNYWKRKLGEQGARQVGVYYDGQRNLTGTQIAPARDASGGIGSRTDVPSPSAPAATPRPPNPFRKK